MKVVKGTQVEFTPVSLTITFESQEEIDHIYNTYAVTDVMSLSGEPKPDLILAVNNLLTEISSRLK
jgi:hypothetical protein